MISYYHLRNSRAKELDRMIVDRRDWAEIVDYLVESPEPEAVIEDSALRLRLFQIDVVLQLDEERRVRLGMLTQYLPIDLVFPVFDAVRQIGKRIDYIATSGFISTVQRVWKGKVGLSRSRSEDPPLELALGRFVGRESRLPTFAELRPIVEGKRGIRGLEKSLVRIWVGLCDSFWLTQATGCDLSDLQCFVEDCDLTLKAEFARQLIWGSQLFDGGKSEGGDALRLMMGAVILKNSDRFPGGSDMNIMFLADAYQGRQAIVGIRAPGWEELSFSLQRGAVGGGSCPSILDDAIRQEDYAKFMIARALLGDEELDPKCFTVMARRSCVGLVARIVENQGFSDKELVWLLFSLGSIWEPDDVEALIPVVRQHVSVDRILNMRDCVGNTPLWYTRYRQGANRQDVRVRVYSLLASLGFDEDVRNEMGLPMRFVVSE